MLFFIALLKTAIFADLVYLQHRHLTITETYVITMVLKINQRVAIFLRQAKSIVIDINIDIDNGNLISANSNLQKIHLGGLEKWWKERKNEKRVEINCFEFRFDRYLLKAKEY